MGIRNGEGELKMTSIHIKYFITFSCALCMITVLLLLPDFSFPIAKENIKEVIGQTIIFYLSFFAMMVSFFIDGEAK